MLTEEALEKYTKVYCEQPGPVDPPTFNFGNVRPASRSFRPPQWLAEGKTLATKASSRASLITRRTRRSTIGSIGAPYDFKKVERPREQGFRPLTLSIHIPGNELPLLPEFDGATCDQNAGLTFPPPVLIKARSESMLSRPSTAFTIPRKPVPPRAVSMDAPRSSMESRYTTNETGRASQSLHRRPSIAASQSTLDFLDVLDTQLPHPPPLLRSKTGPEPVYTLYRRASEQSLRLRTHLEERSQIERHFQECDTILEDKEGDMERSPVSARPSSGIIAARPVPHRLTQPRSTEWFRTPLPPPQPSRAAPAPPSFSLPQSARVVAARTRISQWLRSSPLTSPTQSTEPREILTPFYSLRPSSTHQRTSISSTSIYSNSTTAETTAWTTPPQGSPHQKGSSLSSCWTSVQAGEGGSTGEKLGSMDVKDRDTGVGVAF